MAWQTDSMALRRSGDGDPNQSPVTLAWVTAPIQVTSISCYFIKTQEARLYSKSFFSPNGPARFFAQKRKEESNLCNAVLSFRGNVVLIPFGFPRFLALIIGSNLGELDRKVESNKDEAFCVDRFGWLQLRRFRLLLILAHTKGVRNREIGS